MANAKKKPTPKKKKSIFENDEIKSFIGLTWILLSIFFIVSTLTSSAGFVGEWFRTFILGTLGGVGTFCFITFMLYVGILYFKKQAGQQQYIYITCGVIAVVCASTFHHNLMGTTPQTKVLSSLFAEGITLTGGGVIGGGLCMIMNFLFGKIITGFVLVVIFILCFIILTGVTPYSMYQRFMKRPKREKKLKEVKEEQPKVEKRAINVDIPLPQAIEERVEQIPPQPPKRGFKKMTPKEAQKEAPRTSITHDQMLEGLGLDPVINEYLDEMPDDGEQIILPPVVDDADIIPEEEFPTQEESDLEIALNGATAESSDYCYPPITLLGKDLSTISSDVSGEMRANSIKLIETLKSFGVDATVVNVSRGPSVTRYELTPRAGVKVSKIVGLADDIALNLAATGVRIEAPIPGKSAIGIEIPNASTQSVYLRSIIETDEFKKSEGKLSAALGKNISGNPIIVDLAKMPHILIAGATGSGKSVCINTIITSILYKSSPSEVKLLMVDPKVVELGVYNGIPHLLIPVVTDPKKAAGALNWAVNEMLNRYKLFAESNVRDIKGYNATIREAGEGETMPQIVIIIDELADLMMAAPGDVEDAICRLAQMARAAGMHLVIATQRPSVDVITGVIKANIPSRISFAVSSAIDSRTILDGGGAEKLLGRGDMLYYPTGMAKPLRVQGCFITDKEVESVVNFIKKSQTALYNEKIMEEIEKNAQSTGKKGKDSSDDSSGDEDDSMLWPAIEVIVESGQASVSMLQRRLKLGYARAARLVDEMEERGIVGPYEGSKPRTVLMSKEQFMEMKLRRDI